MGTSESPNLGDAFAEFAQESLALAEEALSVAVEAWDAECNANEGEEALHA